MPWFRKKLLPGSKILQVQKRWFGWLPFGLHIHTYLDLRTPIHKLKEKSVALERELMMCRTQIEILLKDYDAAVKFMGSKVKAFDSDSGPVTQWKHEKNRWWQLSCFQWATPYVEEPPEFDPKLYNFRGMGGRGAPPKRSKDVEMAVNSMKEDSKAFREKMEEQREQQAEGDPDAKEDVRLATFNPGAGHTHLQKRKNESPEDFKKRQEENIGKIEGMD